MLRAPGPAARARARRVNARATACRSLRHLSPSRQHSAPDSRPSPVARTPTTTQSWPPSPRHFAGLARSPGPPPQAPGVGGLILPGLFRRPSALHRPIRPALRRHRHRHRRRLVRTSPSSPHLTPGHRRGQAIIGTRRRRHPLIVVGTPLSAIVAQSNHQTRPHPPIAIGIIKPSLTTFSHRRCQRLSPDQSAQPSLTPPRPGRPGPCQPDTIAHHDNHHRLTTPGSPSSRTGRRPSARPSTSPFPGLVSPATDPSPRPIASSSPRGQHYVGFVGLTLPCLRLVGRQLPGVTHLVHQSSIGASRSSSSINRDIVAVAQSGQAWRGRRRALPHPHRPGT